MINTPFRLPVALLIFVVTLIPWRVAAADDPLPSWRDGASKQAIVAFVDRVADESSPDYVPVEQRVATFDNDGTLWSEQPIYFQAIYALDRIRAMAGQHPEWREKEPYRSAIDGDLKGMMAQGAGPVLKMLMEAHADVTSEAFQQSVSDWLASKRHPDTGMRFTDMVYQPMLELMDYLRANEFKVYIVSGGGIDFLRVFAEDRYGVPPEQVVGTTLEARYELRDGRPVIIKESEVSLIDDKAGKPVGIYRHIGRRPILAGGNSDGDLAMLEYTTIPRDESDTTPRLGLIVHHTDAEREFAYDRDSTAGKLDKGLDLAAERGWLLVDMKSDWTRVYPADADPSPARPPTR